MSAEERARRYAVNAVTVLGGPIAVAAMLALASVPLLAACWLLNAARGWS
jgi:hypothetical protein